VRDADAYAVLNADPDVRRWSSPEAITPEDAARELAAAEQRWREATAHLFAVADDDDRLQGVVNVVSYGELRASIGYDLAPTWRGRGVATAAVRLVTRWAFDRTPTLARIEIWSLVGNGRSDAVALRAGFSREGVLRARLPFAGELRDVTVFSLLRGELDE
jgi:RimJ/RimL family protein N-acetyltransferase